MSASQRRGAAGWPENLPAVARLGRRGHLHARLDITNLTVLSSSAMGHRKGVVGGEWQRESPALGERGYSGPDSDGARVCELRGRSAQVVLALVGLGEHGGELVRGGAIDGGAELGVPGEWRLGSAS